MPTSQEQPRIVCRYLRASNLAAQLIKMGVIPAKAMSGLENAPTRQCGPIHTAWQTSQGFPRLDADHAIITLIRKMGDQLHLFRSRSSGDIPSTPRLLETLVNPRDKQHIAQTCMQYRSPWEQRIREGIAQTTEAKFVNSALLLKQIKDLANLIAIR